LDLQNAEILSGIANLRFNLVKAMAFWLASAKIDPLGGVVPFLQGFL
jgi:hypothetical protein